MRRGGAGDGSGPAARRLRYWRWQRFVDPFVDRTLRLSPRPERYRVTERDGHAADATYPDQRWDANVDTAASNDADVDVDRASDVGGGAAANFYFHAVGSWRVGLR